MRKKTLVTLVLAAILVMQMMTSIVCAASSIPSGAIPVLLDPRDGMYFTRIINLTGQQLSLTVGNDTSNSAFTSSYPQYYSGKYSSSNPIVNQQNVFSQTPIKIGTLLQTNGQPSTALPFWEGMVNVTPLIPASNENSSYITYSGHFSQGQGMTITTANANSALNNAYIQFGYNFTQKTSMQWGKVFDFAYSTIKNAASLIGSLSDEDLSGALSSGEKIISDTAKALQTKPVTSSLNSAATLSNQPVISNPSEFQKTTTTNYAQIAAGFANGGIYLQNANAANNQIGTVKTPQNTLYTITASDNSVRYFMAPSYYIYIKNVQAQNPGDINECTVVLVDGWVYNLALGMYQYQQANPNSTTLEAYTPSQLMYYAGSVQMPYLPNAALQQPVNPTVTINPAQSPQALTIKSITTSAVYPGGLD